MPKLRNAATDTGKIANWLARKLINHNPLGELAKSATDREAIPRFYKAEKSKEVFLMEGDNVVCFAAGRAFAITVREVDPEEARERKLEKVTY